MRSVIAAIKGLVFRNVNPATHPELLGRHSAFMVVSEEAGLFTLMEMHRDCFNDAQFPVYTGTQKSICLRIGSIPDHRVLLCLRPQLVTVALLHVHECLTPKRP
jgi:hypothetical protein